MSNVKLRPGTRFLADAPDVKKLIPFEFAQGEWAILEISASMLRVWIDDRVVTERRI